MTEAAPKRNEWMAELADASDEAELRALLRECPMAGSIALTLEREPSLFYGADVEGEDHQTLIVRHPVKRRILGMGSICAYDAWINGTVQRIGYLSQLRVHPEAQGNLSVVGRGYRKVQDMMSEMGLAYYITTIAADNEVARRFLERSKRGYPRYTPCGTLNTLVLPLSRLSQRAMEVWTGSVRRGTSSDLPRIAEFLRKEFKRYQFSPVYDEEKLQSPTRSRDLKPEDFLVAEENGNIVGCLALWNQMAFKQTVVRGYSPALRRFRHVINLLAPLMGTVHLPPVGNQFCHAYLSHAAAIDEQIFCRLVAEGCLAAKRAKLNYVTLGLGEGHSALQVIKRNFRYMNYGSIIYLVSHGELSEPLPAGSPYLEIARL